MQEIMMAVAAVVQETIIPMVVATPFLVVTTIAASGLFYCFSSVAVMIMDVVAVMVFSAAIITIAVNGLSGLSFSPASAAAITAAVKQLCGRRKNRPFFCLISEY